MQRLGFRMIVRGKGTAADTKWVQRQIGLRALNDGINLGVLVQDGREGTVWFYHQTLHGYFALPGLMKALEHTWWDHIARGSHRFLERLPWMIYDLLGYALVSTLNNRVAFLIEKIGDLEEAGKPATPMLLKALQFADWEVRASAAESLGKLGAAEAVPALIAALHDLNVNVRQRAAWALGRIGFSAAESTTSLVSLLHDEDERVRQTAATSLTKVVSPKATEKVIELIMKSNIEDKNALKFVTMTLYTRARYTPPACYPSPAGGSDG